MAAIKRTHTSLSLSTQITGHTSVFCLLHSDCTDALKNSLAAALRHTREQAQRTYDRRTANDKKQMAVDLAKNYAEASLDGDRQPKEGPRSGADCEVEVGDFVAVVQEDSTFTSPKVLLGQVQSFVGEQDARLLWYNKVKPGLYKLTLDGEVWIEPLDCLVPVQVQSVRSPPGVYKLLTPTRHIHRQVLDS